MRRIASDTLRPRGIRKLGVVEKPAVDARVDPVNRLAAATSERGSRTLDSQCTEGNYKDTTTTLPIHSIKPWFSPRLDGVNMAHAEVLAEQESSLPPILVQKDSLRVVDGMHRLRAAELVGRDSIEVRFFDGDEDAAFLRALAENAMHGLPLSIRDREAAALVILERHPDWSDRAVAQATGLSGKTVAKLRQPAKGSATGERRVGRDGRLRPVNARMRRQVVSELLDKRPNDSVREIALAAGVSPNTVRDVRRRMNRGEISSAELPTNRARDSHPRHGLHPVPAPQSTFDPATTMDNLKRDPSVRYTDRGRELLRLLDLQLGDSRMYEVFLHSLPPHCLPAVISLARHISTVWDEFANRLDGRLSDSEVG